MKMPLSTYGDTIASGCSYDHPIFHLLMTVTVFPDVDDAMYDAILIMKMREIKKDNYTQQ